MPTYQNITHKVTILGNMWNGLEEWSTGFFIGNESGGDMGAAPTVAEAQAIATAWSTFFTHANTGIGTNWKTLGVKVSHVNTAGNADPSLTEYYYYPTAPVGNSAGAHFPPQIALVATLTTARARGYGSKGRMYIPGVIKGLDSTAHIDSSGAAAIATNLKTMFDAINGHADVPGEVVLNSALSAGIPGHPALMEPITGVRVGNVYDTQRRRRNQLVEQYSQVALA